VVCQNISTFTLNIFKDAARAKNHIPVVFNDAVSVLVWAAIFGGAKSRWHQKL
jgi:hypothetical protein